MSRPLLLAIAVIGLLVGGCGIVPSATRPAALPTAPRLDVQIDTPDGPAGLARNGNGVDLYLHASDGGTYKVTSAATGSPPTVHLYTQGGATGRQTNTFVFGDAPAGATAVIVNGSRASVTSRLYVVGLSVRELTPNALSWAFLGPGDNVIEQGSGIKD